MPRHRAMRSMLSEMALLAVIFGWLLFPNGASGITEPPDPCIQGRAEGQTRDRPGPPDTGPDGEKVTVQQTCVCGQWLDTKLSHMGRICGVETAIIVHTKDYDAVRGKATVLPEPWASACVPYLKGKSDEYSNEVSLPIQTCSSYPIETDLCRFTGSTNTIRYKLLSSQPVENEPFFELSTCTFEYQDESTSWEPIRCEKYPHLISGYRLVTNTSKRPGDCPAE